MGREYRIKPHFNHFLSKSYISYAFLFRFLAQYKTINEYDFQYVGFILLQLLVHALYFASWVFYSR